MQFRINRGHSSGSLRERTVEADGFGFYADNRFITFRKERSQGGTDPVLTLRTDDVHTIEVVSEEGTNGG